MIRSRTPLIAAALGVGVALGVTSPAAAAETPAPASCQGAFNGFVNPLLQGTGQLNKEQVQSVGGRVYGAQFVTPGAQTHGDLATCAGLSG